MKFTNILISCALAMSLWSCSSDNAPDQRTDVPDGDVFASLRLSFGRGTRSGTTEAGDGNPSQSDAGFEYGQADENKVQSVLIVLAIKDETTGKYSYITDSGICKAFEIEGEGPSSYIPGKNNPLYRLKFSTTKLAEYAEKEVNVFAYCNPSADLVKKITTATGELSWDIDMQRVIVSADKAEIWNAGNFLMTNGLPATVTLPSSHDMEHTYNKITSPFDLGNVMVERVAARFDFASYTFKDDKNQNLAPNTFPIYEYVGENNVGWDGKEENPNPANPPAKPQGSLELQGFVTIDALSLFNEAKNFYYIPRVAANEGQGQNAAANLSNITVLGQETTTNWVVSPSNKEFFYPLTGSPLPNPDSFTYTPVEQILQGGADSDDGWNMPGSQERPNYRIWRYTTENTPSSVVGQKEGVSTGVLVRGTISANAGTTLGTAITSKRPIYCHEGIMYGNLSQLEAYIAKHPRSVASIAFQTDFGIKIDLTKYDTEAKILKFFEDTNVTDLEESGKNLDVFRISSDGKYHVYYYYKNRHNDNGNNTVMGPMEFATVRNNVYKMRVTNIYRWGNPGDKPTDPNNPDEDPEVYFRVEVVVLPWAVRINDIEF